MKHCSDSNCSKQRKGEVFAPAELVAYAEGAVVSRTVVENCGGTVTLFSFDAGEGLSEHAAPFDALVNVLDGEVKITIGGQPHHLKSGQSIIMPANIPHALAAVTAFKMMLVMIKA
jgi:quercetin dioxygenase-like cupin family protein